MRPLILLLLAGCCPAHVKTPPPCPTTPVVVEVPVEVRSPNPPELTATVAEPHPERLITVGDAVNAAEERRQALAVCNGQLDKLR